MPLRQKALFIIGLSGLGLMIVLIAIFSGFWQTNTAQLEQELSQQNMQQVTQAVLGELDALDRLTGDWAGWDDTYQFVVDHNLEYIDSNLTEETFRKDQVSAIFIIDEAGQIVYSQAYDYEAGTALPLSAQWEKYLPRLTQHATITSSITGLALIDQTPTP